MAKRGNGEGSIYRRKDGDWVAAITIAKDGRRREFYGRTRADVKAKLATAAGDHQRGILPTGHRQTVGAFLNRWIEDSVSRSGSTNHRGALRAMHPTLGCGARHHRP